MKDKRTCEDVFNGVPPPPIENLSWWFKISVVACVLLALYGIIMFGRHYDFNQGYVPRQPYKSVTIPQKDYNFTFNAEKWNKKYGGGKESKPPYAHGGTSKTPQQLFENYGP